MEQGKTALLLLVMIFSSSIVSASAAGNVQGVGVEERVSVDVEQGDHSFLQRISMYCRYYELDSCNGEFTLLSVPGTLYHYFTVEDPEKWYEENRAGQSGSEDEVQHVVLS